LVGEVGKPVPVCPFRVSGVGPDDGARCRDPPTLMGLNRLIEAFTGLRSR